MLSGIVAMLPYVEENPDIVKGFVKAVNRAIEDFKADPAVARKTIGAHTKLPATAIEAMNLGDWETEVPPSEMQFWVDAAKKEGIVNETEDLNSLVWSPKE